MEYNEEIETVINNEYDYSNIITTAEQIGYLVQYCEQAYNQLLFLVEEDEKKNEKLKYEFKNYNYHKDYGTKFEVIIREKTYNNITCKSYSTYLEAVNSNQVKEVNSLEINLNLNYRRGKNDSLKDYENFFHITFKPYDIKFARKSNHSESSMDQIENTIKGMLDKFPAVNSIFCTK